MREHGRTPGWAVVAAGLLLAWPAAWNGYPLVFADSGTYLGQALQFYLGWDRPPHYSLLIHLLHWRVSLWPVPIVQGLVAAHLIALVLRAVGRPGAPALLGVTVLLAATTGLPWLAAQIMPDVFTGLLVLVLWLIAFAWREAGRLERAWLLLLAAAATSVHLGHLPVALGLAALGAGLTWWRRGGAAARRVGLRMAAPAVVAIVALAGANAVGHGRPSVSPFGSVFFAARLIQDGPAVRTLDALCATESWQVCTQRDRMPMTANEFMWPPDGPLRGALGGGKAWAPEASALIRATVAREPWTVLRNALANAALQFAMLRTGDGLEPWRGEPGPEPLIAAYFPRELQAFRDARQYQGSLQDDAATLGRLHALAAWAGLLALPLLGWVRRRHLPVLALCLMVGAAAVANAAVTGGLSGPAERYQARLAWLFVFTPAAVLLAAPAPRRAPPPPERRFAAAPLIREPVERR
jgi:hypothetical protein